MAISAGLIKKAKKQALKSSHKHKMGAIVFRKKNIISKGFNIPTKFIHPSELPFKFRKWPTSLHAEINALLSARRSVKGASILIVRINIRGEMLNAFPCPYCFLYLKFVGIRRIVYSTSEGIKEYLL